MSARPVEIFYSYADIDELLCIELDKHLSQLRHNGLIAAFHKRQIAAGTDWTKALDRHLSTASIILLLISADFMASDYCYGTEVKLAMKRHYAGDARVIPVLLRPVDWHSSPFGKLQALPHNGRPVTNWRSQDDAFLDITRGIRLVCEELLGVNEPLAPVPTIPGQPGNQQQQQVMKDAGQLISTTPAFVTSMGDRLDRGAMKAGRDIRTNNPWPLLLLAIVIIIAIVIIAYVTAH
jgi:hypothetical protein